MNYVLSFVEKLLWSHFQLQPVSSVSGNVNVKIGPFQIGLLHHQNQYHFLCVSAPALRLGFKFSLSQIILGRAAEKFRATLDLFYSFKYWNLSSPKWLMFFPKFKKAHFGQNFLLVFTVANFVQRLILSDTGFCQTCLHTGSPKIDPYQHIKLYLGDILVRVEQKIYLIELTIERLTTPKLILSSGPTTNLFGRFFVLVARVKIEVENKNNSIWSKKFEAAGLTSP